MKRTHPHRLLVVALCLLCASHAGAADDLSKLVSNMDDAAGMDLEGTVEVVPEGPRGEKVLRAQNGFSGRIDLKAKGIEPRDYDLLKVEVKADRAAFLRFSLENYPNPGELSHWYVLDSMRGPLDWQTIWIDLRLPEEIKQAGKYKGMASKDPTLCGLQFTGSVKDTRRKAQAPGRRIWLGKMRFAKKAIDLDWDQSKAPYTWGEGKDLVFRYPLTVTNRLDRDVTVALSLVPFEVKHARADLGADKVRLGPREAKTVEARVILPADVAREAEPLHCERFEARAVAEEVPDSEVTILRSADPIHLTVTVPIPEEKLALPFFPRPSKLPGYVTSFDEECARRVVEANPPEKLTRELADKGRLRDVPNYMATLVSAAYLYDHTGEEKYLAVARELLGALPDVWQAEQAKWRKQPVRAISSGIICHATLSLGWRIGGTQRSPYNYGGCGGNDAAGGMGGIGYVFDFLAPHLDEAFRRKFIEEFLLPAAIQSRNHYIGPGNQQSTANQTTLHGGLAARNWPLVSFAYSSEHGVLGNLEWGFDDDGLCLEGHYQSYTVRPMLWSVETLYGRGVDLYQKRLYTVVHSKGAEAIGMAWPDSFRQFADEQRFAPNGLEGDSGGTDGYHLTGSTLLKWDDLQVAMNWGTHIMRSSHDRCALTIRPDRSNKELRALAVGGGSYNHSSFGQSIVIVDEGLQHSVPADVVSVDVSGPVQHVMAVSDKHYPGSTITRTFALLGRHVLVVDSVRSDRARTVDWFLKGAGRDLSVASEKKEGSWTEKPNDNRVGVSFGAGVPGHNLARTDAAWTEGGGRMTMLGQPGTQIMTWGGKRERPSLIVRRQGVKQTTFVALFSLDAKSVTQVPVKKAGGGAADAVGVKVVLRDGKVFHAVVNYEPQGTEVVLGDLKTTARFATDIEP